MMQGLEHLSFEDRLGAETVWPGVKKSWGRKSSISTNTQTESAKKRESDPFQWCPGTLPEAMDTK